MDRLGPKTSFSGRVDLNLQGLPRRKYSMLGTRQWPRTRATGALPGQEGTLATLDGCIFPSSFQFFREGKEKLVSQNKSHRSCLIHHFQPPAESCVADGYGRRQTSLPCPRSQSTCSSLTSVSIAHCSHLSALSKDDAVAQTRQNWRK